MGSIRNKSDQLMKVLEEAILERKYRAGERVPTEQNLMLEYGLSRVTVRRALQALERAGALRRNSRRGGTVVTENAWALLDNVRKPARKAMTVGVVLNSRWMRDSIIERYYAALIDKLRNEVVFKFFFHDYLQPEKYRSNHCQLLIVNHGYPQDEVAECEKKMPVISFSATRKGNYIYSDNVEGGKRMVKYLAEKGHRHIVCFSEGYAENRLHFEGISAMAKELRVNILPIELTASIFEHIRIGIEKLLSRKSDFSAIIAPTDRDAIKICGLLENAGVKVPDDISVMGADDMFFSEYNAIPLTTLQHPYDAIAEAFANAIREFVKTGNVNVQTLIPENIVERKSVRPLSPAS